MGSLDRLSCHMWSVTVMAAWGTVRISHLIIFKSCSLHTQAMSMAAVHFGGTFCHPRTFQK